MEKCPIIYILDANKNSGEILKSYIEEIGFNSEIKLYEDYNEGLEKIKTESDSIVFVDISQEKDFDKLLSNLKLYTSKIVATSLDYSTNTIVKAMRFGAKEFLTKPIIKGSLNRILTILSQYESEKDSSASKIISIFSNKGGIGKTTIATNLAIELAKSTGDKVALIDLNLQLGDISTFLNINPCFDVAYVLKNLVEKREDTLLKAFEKYKDTGLYVLSDPNYIEQSESITPQQIELLFKAIRKIFPYIIIDLSSNIDANSLKILDKSDWILFTSIVNIPAIRNAQRCLNLFRSRNYPKNKVKLIINRFMENDEIKIEDIESTIGEKIYWKIPNNYFSIMDSINKGLPVSEINSNSNIANSFRDLAIKVSEDIIEQTISKYRGT